ncbi:MAG: hypothetical protein QME75_03025 [Deltaproteobacteria bacterium]|nr:hypothetical protein [Deltaproteobacteria bacterium]
MPEKCRVSVCGFDPMLVRGYVKTGFRALWFYLPDELYEDYDVQIGDKIQGKLQAVINPKEERTFEGNETFEWSTSKETGYAVLIPAEIITKYELTEFHFIEVELTHIVRVDKGIIDIYPGETKQRKWWPDGKMKLSYYLPYAAP